MEDKNKIVRSTFEDGRVKFGKSDDKDNIFYLEDYIQMIALDTVGSYGEIIKGEKKQEETNIDLQLRVLDSLSNALKSLGVILYH